jgi:hypothetical protein
VSVGDHRFVIPVNEARSLPDHESPAPPLERAWLGEHVPEPSAPRRGQHQLIQLRRKADAPFIPGRDEPSPYDDPHLAKGNRHRDTDTRGKEAP